MEQMRNIVGTQVKNESTTSIGRRFETMPRTSSIYDSKTSISNKQQSQAKSKMNTLGKIRIICFFSVLSLLLFLFIYNFVAMSSLGASISGLESTIASEQTQINELKSQINSLSGESAIVKRAEDAGFSADAQINDGIMIVEVPKVELKTVQEQTNWFNEFCKFVSSVFGG